MTFAPFWDHRIPRSTNSHKTLKDDLFSADLHGKFELNVWASSGNLTRAADAFVGTFFYTRCMVMPIANGFSNDSDYSNDAKCSENSGV
ncbi:hypothetical protein, partial [Enterovibrio norvegicus]|uniref:hypothetical protein n=1 Tax=Enterovibrio norvegicus TaxID=188144 RepID=UPI001A7E088A